MNDRIISIFKGLRRYNEIENDIWRAKAYREAIDVLESIEYDIHDIDDIPKLAGLGKRSMDKINKIINGATWKILYRKMVCKNCMHMSS